MGAGLSERGHNDDWDLLDPVKRGRTFVYVLRSLGEDLTKVGFTQDPIQRFRTFHPRFFALFDLEQGMLVETGRLRDARRLERLLIERWPAHRASAPLLVSDTAGGQTEWFRGIGEEVGPFVSRIAERYSYTLHVSLSSWLRTRFAERADQLYDWSQRLLEMIEWQAANVAPEAHDPRYAKVLIDTLDACRAVGVELSDLLPPVVLVWYDSASGSDATRLFDDGC